MFSTAMNALDTDRMLKDLKKIIEDARARPFPRAPKVIIVEGIFAFTFPYAFHIPTTRDSVVRFRVRSMPNYAMSMRWQSGLVSQLDY